MKYWNTDTVVRVGDRVAYAKSPGTVVFVVDDNAYSDDFPEVWSYLGKGVGVKLDEGTLFHFESAENEEDLEPLHMLQSDEVLTAFPLARNTTGELSHGQCIAHRNDGSRLCEVSFRNGRTHGRYRDFWPNGTVACEGEFDNGKKQGVWHYYDAEGLLTEIIEYERGREIRRGA